MEDGDTMLVDRGVSEIREDGIFVIALDDELYVKRVQRRLPDKAIIIKSDNPHYEPMVVENGDRNKLEILGRVVWVWKGIKL
ncbi:Putative phage repressor [Methyloversatilis universalis FAM5]|uniref:Phage repressor n=1 Tax=Methyloversatilis universalis (strain ATCC BAA-1314 / DSM 25237 / JCM 13912 / CCUG 52030 / FAM5) TaxID=1000565 RepID=F5RBR5_METUF|nr:Putative phage repressor [Methyloversatilis universalis FAM5]